MLTHFGSIEDLRPGALDDDVIAQFEYGQALLSRRLAAAMEGIERAATRGHPDAQYDWAQRVFRATANPPNLYATAIQRLTEAAEKGRVGAMVFLAGRYAREGRGGVTRDPEKARSLFRQALNATDDDRLFDGQTAGRPVIIKRASIERRVKDLD